MHCLCFNMLGKQRPRQSPSANVSIAIDKTQDGSEKVFDTFDCVKGKATVSVNRKIDLEKINITFEGIKLTSALEFCHRLAIFYCQTFI